MRNLFPPGSSKQVALIEADGTYAGLVQTADLYATETDLDKNIGALARYVDTFLLPETNIQRALDAFKRSEADALVVLRSVASRKIVGLVSEAHAFRRYGEELERQNKEFIK